jgi:hemoglobin
VTFRRTGPINGDYVRETWVSVSDVAPSHYERIGGAATIRVAVDRFYQLVVADADLAPYFADVDMSKLKRHQVQLLSGVLGGPSEYGGQELEIAHAGLGITDAQYTKVAGYLTDVLRDLGAPADVIDAAASVVDSVRNKIVSGAAG